MKKRVLVLGATGSIGNQTLDIIRNMKEDFELCGVSAGKDKQKISKICKEFNCPGTVFDEDGKDGLLHLFKSSNADIAVNGVSGASGLLSSVLALQNGINLALANKESIVMAWDIIKGIADKNSLQIIPVDSEHSAIFNLIHKIGRESITSLIITASGGPFRLLSKAELKNVSVEDALKHPSWKMGSKITIDSATLANKGLEIIEACRLFDFESDKVQVVIHPQSIIHSLVRTKDGMLYAQISEPDMRHPILSALTWPECKENYLKGFDLALCNEMTFSRPRYDDFPLLNAAYNCIKQGDAYPIAFNAANEIAAEAFLNHKCGFTDISTVVQKTIEKDFSGAPNTLEKVYAFDQAARQEARNTLASINRETK